MRTDSGAVGSGKLVRWVFYASLLTYIPLMRGHFFSVDEIEVYQQCRSWWERGDFATAPLVNTVVGPDGQSYAPYSVGQSLLALPLFGAGRAVQALFPGFSRFLAGPVLGDDPRARWGGDVEIFFVLLLSCMAIAGVNAVFTALQLHFGARPRVAVISTLLAGFASYPAGLAATFYQHGLESLFLLWCFYFLAIHRPGAAGAEKTVRNAGLCAGAMVLVRVQSAIALPALCLYLLWTVWEAGGVRDWRARTTVAIQSALPFVAIASIALLLTGIVNHMKTGAFSLTGIYAKLVPFHTPMLWGMHGFLFSPSRSLFFFTPLLFAAPWYYREFLERYRAEAMLLLSVAVSYLLLYSGADGWHGMWCFGPRYLTAIVPLLLVPMGRWMSGLQRWERAALIPLGAAGAFVAILHFSVNPSYALLKDGWDRFGPEYMNLFSPQNSQIEMHWRALTAMDGRVDFWLLNLALVSNKTMAALTGAVLAAGAGVAWWRVAVVLRGVERAGVGAEGVAASGFLTAPLRAVAWAWGIVIVAVSVRHLFA